MREQAGLADSELFDAKLNRLTRMWRSRHKCFKEIQSVLVDAANKWLDQEVAPAEQRKALREVQRLYKKLRSQVETQDKLLTDVEVRHFTVSWFLLYLASCSNSETGLSRHPYS